MQGDEVPQDDDPDAFNFDGVVDDWPGGTQGIPGFTEPVVEPGPEPEPDSEFDEPLLSSVEHSDLQVDASAADILRMAMFGDITDSNLLNATFDFSSSPRLTSFADSHLFAHMNTSHLSPDQVQQSMDANAFAMSRYEEHSRAIEPGESPPLKRLRLDLQEPDEDSNTSQERPSHHPHQAEVRNMAGQSNHSDQPDQHIDDQGSVDPRLTGPDTTGDGLETPSREPSGRASRSRARTRRLAPSRPRGRQSTVTVRDRQTAPRATSAPATPRATSATATPRATIQTNSGNLLGPHSKQKLLPGLIYFPYTPVNSIFSPDTKTAEGLRNDALNLQYPGHGRPDPSPKTTEFATRLLTDIGRGRPILASPQKVADILKAREMCEEEIQYRLDFMITILLEAIKIVEEKVAREAQHSRSQGHKKSTGRIIDELLENDSFAHVHANTTSKKDTQQIKDYVDTCRRSTDAVQTQSAPLPPFGYAIRIRDNAYYNVPVASPFFVLQNSPFLSLHYTSKLNKKLCRRIICFFPADLVHQLVVPFGKRTPDSIVMGPLILGLAASFLRIALMSRAPGSGVDLSHLLRRTEIHCSTALLVEGQYCWRSPMLDWMYTGTTEFHSFNNTLEELRRLVRSSTRFALRLLRDPTAGMSVYSPTGHDGLTRIGRAAPIPPAPAPVDKGKGKAKARQAFSIDDDSTTDSCSEGGNPEDDDEHHAEELSQAMLDSRRTFAAETQQRQAMVALASTSGLNSHFGGSLASQAGASGSSTVNPIASATPDVTASSSVDWRSAHTSSQSGPSVGGSGSSSTVAQGGASSYSFQPQGLTASSSSSALLAAVSSGGQPLDSAFVLPPYAGGHQGPIDGDMLEFLNMTSDEDQDVLDDVPPNNNGQ